MSNFKPQKGEHIRKVTEPLRWPFLGSIKLDGIRAETWNGSTLTYSLKEVPNDHIRNLLASHQFLDGEVIVGPPNLDSTFNTTTSAVRRKAGTPDFKFYVFDDISPQALTLPFAGRLELLRRRILPSFIKVLEQRPILSQQECDSYYQELLDLGYEGMMLRKASSMYKFGRCTVASQDCIKMKPEEDDEAVVLGVMQGLINRNEAFTNEHGRTARSSHMENLVPSGLCGGFRSRDLKTGREFIVSPGKMSHDLRKWVWENRERVQREAWIVKYRHSPTGVLVGGLPRFPRWVGWRDAFDM